MAHQMNKLEGTETGSTIKLRYFCEYWGLPEGSNLTCNLNEMKDCTECPYLKVQVDPETSHVIPKRIPAYPENEEPVYTPDFIRNPDFLEIV